MGIDEGVKRESSLGFRREFGSRMMIDIIRNGQRSNLPLTLFLSLKIDRFGRFKDLPFMNVFNRDQQAAIVRFLKFLLFNLDGITRMTLVNYLLV